MHFLGKLGIDIKLLIAQIINFGILLLLLKKLLYKPIIKKIEEDENQLQQAKIQQEKLKKEKEEFKIQKENEMKKARQRAEEIIKEAEEIAFKIRKSSQEEAEKEIKRMIKYTEEKLNLKKPEIEKEITLNLKRQIKENFSQLFNLYFTPNQRKKIDNIFFEKLINHLQNLNVESNQYNLENTEYVILEYTSLNNSQFKKINDIILKKIKLPIKIEKRKNTKLISGFRLEILGKVIEANLKNLLYEASKINQK